MEHCQKQSVSFLSKGKFGRQNGDAMNRKSDPAAKQNPGWLLFWPVFGLRYLLLERFHPTGVYHPVRCSLDDRIPFTEGFLIPYFLWYFCMIGVHLWLLIRNDPAYRQYSGYLVLTMSVSTLLFLLYPTCQDLRPDVFYRSNCLTDGVALLYRLDTNTNVCPSEHVIGSAGFFLAVTASSGTGSKHRVAAGVTAFLTAVATVFLKQHSLIDVVAAVPVCLLGWFFAFSEKRTQTCFVEFKTKLHKYLR